MRRLQGLFLATSLLALSSPALAQDLAPPPPMKPQTPGQPGAPQGTDAQQAATTQKLDEAEQQDSGRNFELFYLDGQIGGAYTNMAQFSAEDLAVKNESAGGPSFSVGAGVRFVILVLGARLRHNALSSFNMWQINAEAGLKIPVSQFDILFGLHGGYSFAGRLGDAGVATNSNTPTAADAVSIRGWNAGLDVAFDYYVSPLFSVGAGILGDFLFLNRPPVDKPSGFDALTQDQKTAILNDPLYQKSGTSAGLAFGGGLRLGLHFGL